MTHDDSSATSASWFRRAARAPMLLLFAAAAVALCGCQVVAPAVSSAQLKECRVAALGDSLTVGVQPYLAESLEAKGCTLAWIDAKGGRKTGEGVDILAARAANNDVPPVLIVGLGTNDRYELAHFASRVDRVMEVANGRHVIWVDNAYTPVRNHVNNVLTDRARRYPNLTLMSWNEPYWANVSWRASDNVHATPSGYKARADMMADAANNVVK